MPEKNSPWLGKPKQEPEPVVEAADLPDEVYDAKVDDDDEKIERAIANARLIETPAPPEPQWRVCWACGKKVPLRFRDSTTGILVCRQCLVAAVQQDFYEKVQGLFGGIGDFLGSYEDGDDEDEGDEPMPGDLSEVLEGEEAPEVPQGNTPHIIEKAGGPAAKSVTPPVEGENEPKEK